MISEGLMRNLNVKGLCDDSRRVKAQDLFFSMPAEGYEEFARNAVASGAVAVVSEQVAPEGLASKWIQVASVKAARLEAAKIFYKDSFSKLRCHAVTGTNGKTTSAFLMNAMLESAGKKTALLGTIKNKIGESSVPASLTTPGLLDLFAFAAKAVAAGCTDLVMEASSHSLHQGRVDGIGQLVYEGGVREVFAGLGIEHAVKAAFCKCVPGTRKQQCCREKTQYPELTHYSSLPRPQGTFTNKLQKSLVPGNR